MLERRLGKGNRVLENYSKFAIVSFVLILTNYLLYFGSLFLGIVLRLYYVGLFVALISFILGFVAVGNIKKENLKGLSLAVVSMILSVSFPIAMFVLPFVFLIGF